MVDSLLIEKIMQDVNDERRIKSYRVKKSAFSWLTNMENGTRLYTRGMIESKKRRILEKKTTRLTRLGWVRVYLGRDGFRDSAP